MPPLTEKGAKIKHNMEREYGKTRGERVFYASRNKGTISGVDRAAESERQTKDLADGKYVSGRDRAKLRTRRG